jgi:hypothetical protein
LDEHGFNDEFLTPSLSDHHDITPASVSTGFSYTVDSSYPELSTTAAVLAACLTGRNLLSEEKGQVFLPPVT